MLIKPVDIGIILIALAGVIASFVFAYGGTDSPAGIIIKSENGEWIYPLDAAETVTVPGALGDTIVEIQNSSARVLSSPCKNQTCVAAGAVFSHGQWTACLPNKVMIYIESSSSQKPKRTKAGANKNVDATSW